MNPEELIDPLKVDAKNFEAIQMLVRENVEIIAFNKKTFEFSLEHATKFLVVKAVLSNSKRELEIERSKVNTALEAQNTVVIGKSQAKTISEKKLDIALDSEYVAQRERLELLEANISWVKTNIEIFNDAHITYRNLMKGE